MFAAPVLERIRHRAVERVFAQDKNLRVWIFGQGMIENFGNDMFRREFHLDADYG